MNKDYTHITVILDRSGSMEAIRNDTIGGFNAFLAEQKALPGRATLTLVQFDSGDSYHVVHRFKPLARVPKLTRKTFVPRGTTPLLDALGRAINDVEATLAAMKDSDRPSRVLIAVITDGQENASREFTRDRIAELVREKTEKDGWEFLYLSAHLDAFADAAAVGISALRVARFAADSCGTAQAWTTMSKCAAQARSGRLPRRA